MSKEKSHAQITATLGTETHVSDWFEMTQEKVDAFAKLTHDEQWIHTNPDIASKFSPFGSTVAHGFFTLSLTTFLSGVVDADKTTIEGVKLGVNYGLNKVRFPAPVTIPSRIRAHVTPQEVTAVEPNGLQIISKITVEIEGGTKPVCVAESIGRMYF